VSRTFQYQLAEAEHQEPQVPAQMAVQTEKVLQTTQVVKEATLEVTDHQDQVAVVAEPQWSQYSMTAPP
jgi:hypothetical protein